MGAAAYRPLGGRALPRLFRGHVDCLRIGWWRPFVVAGLLMLLAALLEALQSLQPNHPPNLFAALSGAGGALSAALLAKFII
jgi:hypothetical protein